jgi:hypothetical protein
MIKVKLSLKLVEPPYIETISKYFYQNYMRKPKEERKSNNAPIIKVAGKKI